jgi:hypothetical protein
MWARLATGIGALGLYGWRIEDPKGSYAAFYDVSNWLSAWIVSGDGAWQYARNFINLILIDQVDGFLLGMAFMALISAVLWPLRASTAWAGRCVVEAVRRRQRSTPSDDARPDADVGNPTTRSG